MFGLVLGGGYEVKLNLWVVLNLAFPLKLFLVTWRAFASARRSQPSGHKPTSSSVPGASPPSLRWCPVVFGTFPW